MITPEQLAKVQADLDVVKAAVAEEINAFTKLDNNRQAMDELQTTIDCDTADLESAKVAVAAADQILLDYVIAMVNANPTT